jgi:hypothetical protein
MRKRDEELSDDSDDGYQATCKEMERAMTKLSTVNLGVLVPTDPDAEGWSTVVKESTIKSKKGLATEEQCVAFSSAYNRYFTAVFGVNIDFIITPISQPYVSVLEACMLRDNTLRSMFTERPIVLDPMGGCGSDAVAMLVSLFPLMYILCDHYMVGEGQQAREWETVNHNISRLQQAFPELTPPAIGEKNAAPVVVIEKIDCAEYIMGMAEGSRVDLLYLDPNWSISIRSQYELTPQGLVQYLDTKVFAPLRARNITPHCIVFKTRWASTILEPFMRLLTSDYHCTTSIEATPFREHVDESRNTENGEIEGRFHWMIIVNEKIKQLVWKKTRLYMDIVRKNRSVIINGNDCLHLKKPLYSKQERVPVEQSEEIEGETFVVEQHHKPSHPVRRGRA